MPGYVYACREKQRQQPRNIPGMQLHPTILSSLTSSPEEDSGDPIPRQRVESGAGKPHHDLD
jgi:hypothetical protein